MPLLRRFDAYSGSNVRHATGVPDHRAANGEKESTLTKQANDFRGRIFSREDIFARIREKVFSREDIFAERYFRVNSKFAKISSRENISNSLFANFSSRENKVLYSIIAVHYLMVGITTHFLTFLIFPPGDPPLISLQMFVGLRLIMCTDTCSNASGKQPIR